MKAAGRVACVMLILFLACTAAGCARVHKLDGDASLYETLEREGYVLKWSDEFDGDRLDETKWKSGYSTPARRGGYYLNDPDTVFVSDGSLTIRTRYLEDGIYGEGWYTGWLETATYRTAHNQNIPVGYEGFAAKYGYFEVRCICPPTVGIWSAFWLMPNGGLGMHDGDIIGTGADGVEIDIMESPYMYMAANKDRVTHVLHGDGYGEYAVSVNSEYYKVKDMYSEYHTYGVMWTETEYVFYIDGIETWRTDMTIDGVKYGVSEQEEYILLTVEVGGTVSEDGSVAYPGENSWCGDPMKNDTDKNYDFIVDYVRYYAKT